MKFDRILFSCFAFLFAVAFAFSMVVLPGHDPFFATIVALDMFVGMVGCGFIASRC